jgi:hypothetical protein
MATRTVLVVNGDVKNFTFLKALPLFRKAKFVKAGRLLTAKEFEARRKAADSDRKSAEIAAFYEQEMEMMEGIAASAEESQRVAKFFASARAIRNHST